MKRLLFLIAIVIAPEFAGAQSCDKTSCGPAGTKKDEAAAITTMRADLQTVISRMSKSSVAFDKAVSEMEVEKGATDDESLLFISQAATTVRHELLNKVEPSKMVTALKEFKPAPAVSKQQMVSNLKSEIDILNTQAGKL
jgi:hypothetical protein